MTTRVLQSTEDWTHSLGDLAEKATTSLDLVSPWVSYGAVTELLSQIRPESGAKARLLVRWPVYPSEAQLVQGAQLRRLRSRQDVSLRFVDPHLRLHAKVYVRDGVAGIVGSANLTSSGTGVATNGDTNCELGMYVDGVDAEGLANWIEEHWRDANEFTDDDLDALERWAKSADTSSADLHAPPKPTTPNRHELAREAIKILVRKGVIHNEWAPAPRGFGVRAFKVRMLRGGTGDTVIRVHFSTFEKQEGTKHYHFGFYASDLKHARKAGMRASRVVMVPLSHDLAISNDRPIVVLPVNSVFRRQGQKQGARPLNPDYFFSGSKKSRAHTTMTAYLESRGPRGGWNLRVPTPSRRSKKAALIKLLPHWVVQVD